MSGEARLSDEAPDHVVAPDRGPGSKPTFGMLLLVALPGLIVVLSSVMIAAFAGKPEDFPSVGVYRGVLNAAVLLRFFGMFLAIALVWWELRARRAGRAVLIAAVISGPLTYAVVEAFRMLSFFPPLEAAYYMVNPLAVAALGSQTAMAGVVELLWRAVGRCRGRWPGRVLSWGVALAIFGGVAVVYFAVLHAGGTTGFFLYSAGYRWLFT